MHRRCPACRLLVLGMLAGAARAGAQASPFLPMDDPRVPLIEHFIARGDVRDPNPMLRPFRRSDVKGSPEPLASWLTDPAGAWGRFSAHSGAQGYTQGRRDLLQSGGDGGFKMVAEAEGTVVSGAFVASVRGALENRLKDDPDWPDPSGIIGKDVVPRVVDGYAGVQLGWLSFYAGQLSHNWGPAGIPGIAVSDLGYPRPELGLTLGDGRLRYAALATKMHDGTSLGGARVERYLVQHRLAFVANDRLTLAAWELGVMAGTGDELDGATRAIAPLLVLPALVTSKGHRNEMIGGGVSWRPTGRVRLEAELAIDDWNFDNNNPYPQRWAMSLAGAGALGRRASWRATFTTASSLAFRTLEPSENIADRGVGIGRTFPDNVVTDFSVGLPVRSRWLVSPRIALLRQGEGRIQDPFPGAQGADTLPTVGIGTIATSLWSGVRVSGWEGPLQLSGEAGLRHTSNAGHTKGNSRTTFEARVTATLGVRITSGAR